MAIGSRMPCSSTSRLVRTSGERSVESTARTTNDAAAIAGMAARPRTRRPAELGSANSRRRRAFADPRPGPRGSTQGPSAARKMVWKMTWTQPTSHETWATLTIGVSSMTATKPRHGFHTASAATRAGEDGHERGQGAGRDAGLDVQRGVLVECGDPDRGREEGHRPRESQRDARLEEKGALWAGRHKLFSSVQTRPSK